MLDIKLVRENPDLVKENAISFLFYYVMLVSEAKVIIKNEE